MLLEKQHDVYNENHRLRMKAEEKMSEVREIHRSNTKSLSEQRKKGIMLEFVVCINFLYVILLSGSPLQS